VALMEALFGRPGPTKLDVADLTRRVSAAAGRLTGPADLPLVRARLADHGRDAGRDPLTPEEFDALAAALDEEARRRLAVLVGLLDAAPKVLAVPGSTPAVVKRTFFAVAAGTSLLTLELLRQSPLRAEEFARRFAAALEVPIQGETAAASKQRLDRLDYGRLTAEAAAAKAAAEERMAKLRQKQEEVDQRRSRRGKW
jgi:hypothetical protein